MLSVCQDVAKSAIPSGTFSSSKLFYFFLLFLSRLLTFLFHVISAKVLPHIYRCNVLLDRLKLINSSSPTTCVSVGWILFFATVSTFYGHRWNKWWQIVAVVVVAFLARRVMQETIDEQPSSTATAANCPATGGRDFEATHPNTSPFIAGKKRIVRKRITAAARFDWFWYLNINFISSFF